MWLLDANIPLQPVALLKELGVDADSAISRGWYTFSNGRLVEAAAGAKFSALLTRDRLFAESAANVLIKYPDFCVVRVTLAQARAPRFLLAFRSAWRTAPIAPVPGQIVDWPPT